MRPQPADQPIRVYLLGGFRVELGGGASLDASWGRSVPGRLFKCLLGQPNQRLLNDQVFELFWPSSDPDAAAKNLRSALSRVRATLLGHHADRGADLFVSGHGAVGIRPDAAILVDADAFEETLRRARQADDPHPLLEEADRLYGGHLLPDDLYEAWAGPRRDALRRLWSDLQLQLARLREALGDLVGAIAALQRRFDDDPCDELAARELMTLVARDGRSADAARVYERLARSLEALDPDLHLRPSTETEAVRRQIGAGEAAPPGSPRQTAAAAPPPAPFTPSYPFPTPDRLVGRRAELAVLERTLAHGRSEGQVVFVAAPAGTGKSTLVGALVRHARETGVLCLAGGSYEQQGIVPLGPFRDALGDYLLLQPPERLRAELGDAAADLAEIIPELRYHLSLPDLPATGGDPNLLFGSVSRCLAVLSAQRPVLLCLEDLHAADAGTVALLERLARRVRSLAVTIVCTYRIEELPVDHPLGRLLTRMTREGAQYVRLGPLDRDETTRLVAALLDGPTSDQLDTSLYEATEGNPLFVEQLILALREEGRVDRRGGVWHQIDRSPHGLPTIIRDVLGRRFEHLSARCAETLAMAAVLGRTVDHAELLASLGSGDEHGMMDHLAEAFEAQVLGTTPTGSAYAFTHALLREAVYWDIPAPRRMALHARAGDGLERLFGERAADRAAIVAYHYVNAGHAAEIRAKASRFSIEAGRRAVALSAYHEALAHFSRACELIERNGDRDASLLLDALEGREQAQRELGHWQPCIETSRRLLELCDEPPRCARARAAIGRALEQMGDTAGALAAYDAGLEELDPSDDGPETVSVRLQLLYDKAFPWLLEGRYSEVLRVGRGILEAAERLGQPQALARAHSIVALAHMRQGQAEQSAAHFEQALATAERAADRLQMAVVHENFGTHCHLVGDFEEAHRHVDQALALYRQSGSEHRTVLALVRRSQIRLAEGQVEPALEQAQHARALALEWGDRWIAECDDALGAVYAARADLDAAEASFRRALAAHQEAGRRRGSLESLLGLGLVADRRGDWSTAEVLYGQALELAETMDPGPLTIATRRHLGQLLLRRGDIVSAIEQLKQACTLAETMPRSLESAPTFQAMAEALRQSDSPLSHQCPSPL